MSLNNLGLGFVFTARDLASGAIQNLERNFLSLDRKVGLGTERIESSFQQLGVGLAVFSAGAGVVAGAFALANAAGRLEQSLAAVGAISARRLWSWDNSGTPPSAPASPLSSLRRRLS